MEKKDIQIIRDVLEMLSDCKFHDLPIPKAVEQVAKLQKLAKLLSELDNPPKPKIEAKPEKKKRAQRKKKASPKKEVK